MKLNLMHWAENHDWFHSSNQYAPGEYEVWVIENGKLHPFPFRSYAELRTWAGY